MYPEGGGNHNQLDLPTEPAVSREGHQVWPGGGHSDVSHDPAPGESQGAECYR